MNEIESKAIGLRIRELRKRKGYSQTELANLLGKSLRTIQKYESGEIEIPISVINELARKLNTTSTYLLGNKSNEIRIERLSDVMGFLFHLEKVMGVEFSIDIKKPPHDDKWQGSLVFSGKNKNADFNADMCLFLEEWANYREDVKDSSISKEQYNDWQDKTLAYYSAINLENEE